MASKPIINSSDQCVEYDFEVELHSLIDHNVMIHVKVREDGECWYDDTGPGHMEYTQEITGFSIEYIDPGEEKQVPKWWYFEWVECIDIPLAIAAGVAIAVGKHFQDKTLEDMELIMHGNDD